MALNLMVVTGGNFLTVPYMIEVATCTRITFQNLASTSFSVGICTSAIFRQSQKSLSVRYSNDEIWNMHDCYYMYTVSDFMGTIAM